MWQDEGLSRRGFIGAGSIALALAASRLSFGFSPGTLSPYRALYDERYASGRAFGAEAADQGWVCRSIRGDITKVWFRELAPRWRVGPAAVVGVTTAQTLFVLERLAWDAGLRVMTRDSVSAAEPVIRWVIAPPGSAGRR